MIEQLTLTGEVEDSWDQEFDQWWKGYPVKRDKAPARMRFRTLRRRGVTLESLERARDAYLRDCQREGRLVKYPKTFLGVWDEWDVPEIIPDPARNGVLSPPDTKFCPDCREMAQYCLCGQEMRRR